jgi:hypothetical protein
MAYDPFTVQDRDGLLHTWGLIEDDRDWTDYGREVGSVEDG